MGLNVGSPYIPPDNTLLNVSATGALQLKPGTQGDILYAGASGTWAKLGTGTVGQYLKALGAGANPAWANPPGEGWTALVTLNPSATTSQASGALGAYDDYLVCFAVTAAGTAYVQMQLNADTGANYSHTIINDAALSQSSGNTATMLCETSATGIAYGYAQLTGKTRAIASGQVSIVGGAGKAGAQGLLRGSWTGGNATQISSMTFISGSAFTGKIEIYGRTRAA